jgi:hypothetical protein
MRRIALLLVPSLAFAETRIEQDAIPSLTLLEPVYHLDRGEKRRLSGAVVTSALGYGSHDGDGGLVGEGTLAIGKRTKKLSFGAASSLVLGDTSLVRGRHLAFVELDTDATRSNDDLAGRLTVAASLEHGEARGLAPVELGPGKRNHIESSADALIGLEPDGEEVFWAALIQVEGSATYWLDTPLLDRARRGAAGLGISFAPDDRELPRGRLDVMRARVEHTNIERTWTASAGRRLRDTQVRTIEVMIGAHEFTGHIDRELLVSGTAELGAEWIESDVGGLSETMAKFNLAIHAKWRKRNTGRREFGFAFSRDPSTTPDGQQLATDTRLDMVAGAEDKRFIIEARGGISWVNHRGGGWDGDPPTVKRYGSHVQGFLKLPFGFEAGGYHSATYEPRAAGDPWGSPRAWAIEAGLLARYRYKTF